MQQAGAAARRLLESTGEHQVISVYFDLDPEQFATAPARATQARSLIDQGEKLAHSRSALDHAERTALTEGFARLAAYLASDELPVEGPRALGIFCSELDGLFLTLQLAAPVPPRVDIGRWPRIEPLVVGHDYGQWYVALVNRRDGRIFAGPPPLIGEREDIRDDVHRQHKKGGWSQANYQRSADDEAETHLRRVAEDLLVRFEEERFRTLVVGGPPEVVAEFKRLLPNDLQGITHKGNLDLDLSAVREADVRQAVHDVLAADDARLERESLEELTARLAARGRAAGGIEGTLESLAERRVERLLINFDFEASGGRCPACGLLSREVSGVCPADGTELEPIDDLREAAVQSAVRQDAEIIVAEDPPEELKPPEGIGALLRF